MIYCTCEQLFICYKKESDPMERTFIIHNLDCAHCGAKIETALNNIDGIESAVLNYPLKKLIIKGDITAELIELINKTANSIEAGVVISPAEHGRHHHYSHNEHHDECDCGHSHEHHHHDECGCGHSHEHHHHDECGCGHSHEHLQHDEYSHGDGETHLFPVNELVSLALGAILFAAALLCGRFTDIKLLPVILYAAAYIVLGHNILLATLKNIRAKNFFDENFLMTVATIGAFALGEYPEAVGVVLFFRIGELFEDYAVSRSRKSITDVAALKVEKAEVLRDGEFVSVHSDEIQAGDILRIKAGERIAADGIIESGESRLDTSAVNGEPVPLTVKTGDSVLSGCINLSETLTLRATAAASDSMISKIADAVENASATKPHIDRFITRFAKVYTPIVIAIAVLTALIPSIITGNWSKWVYSALTFLVISCPCALVLSVPLTYFSGIGAASKLGILFKGGNAIEALGRVKAVAFDKTGTLTDGSFSVTDIKKYGDISENELLSLGGSCEQCSSHPVAESIVEYCRNNNIALSEPEKSKETAGQGVSAIINGKKVLCGSERLMTANSIAIPDDKTPMGSVVYVAVNGKISGRIIVSDTVKKTASSAISNLKALGLRTFMLTGDKADNAEAVAKMTDVDEFKADLLPDEKLAEIERIRSKNGSVMFIGDGFNDGPVLAGADIGGAMQNGSDLALEAADAVFMNSEPESVVKAKKIADKTMRISYENIIFALGIKAAVIVLGLLGHPNMWFAVFADSGAAMICILNAVRVLNTKRY